MNGYRTSTSIQLEVYYKQFLVLPGVKMIDTCKGHPHGQLGSNMDLPLLGAREKVLNFICLYH